MPMPKTPQPGELLRIRARETRKALTALDQFAHEMPDGEQRAHLLVLVEEARIRANEVWKLVDRHADRLNGSAGE